MSTTVSKGIRLSSASGIISLLDESCSDMKIFALDRLIHLVDEFWPEISDVVTKLEILYEDKQFTERAKVAFLVSKLYYHLGSFQDSLSFALNSSPLFEATAPSDYYNTIMARAIDQYTALQTANAVLANSKPVDQRLENMVNTEFQRCIKEGELKQVIGIAIDTRRLDILERAIEKSSYPLVLLDYTFQVTVDLVNDVSFRKKIMGVISKLYSEKTKSPNFTNQVQCLIYQEDHGAIAQLLKSLLLADNALLAYQIAFDLHESAFQVLLINIIDILVRSAPIPNLILSTKDAQVKKSSSKTSPTPVPKVSDLPQAEQNRQKQLIKLVSILNGDVPINIDFNFLVGNSRPGDFITTHMKTSMRNPIMNSAIAIGHGFYHCGTTRISESFEPSFLNFYYKWGKFLACSSLGVTHRRYEKDAIRLLSLYVNQDANPYLRGGALYAIGLIHANHGTAQIRDHLLQQIEKAPADAEAVFHGASLAIGLASMGTQDSFICNKLKNLLYQDNCNVGDAAGLGMGLVMLGSGNETVIKDMLAYGRETLHQKIVRGLGMGVALIVFNRAQEADILINKLLKDKDQLMRKCAMHCIAMAYCGTASNSAIQKLLHAAVSDVNNDVRRSAVEAIGFVLFRQPEECINLVSLLAASYNPHVRCGAVMALGIACAGTGNQKAVAILRNLNKDSFELVRQYIGIAVGMILIQQNATMILIQQNATMSPQVKNIRKMMNDHMSSMVPSIVRFGIILGKGIIDAGDKNLTLSLQTRGGHINPTAVVGMFVFTQFWYWYPFAQFLSLALNPTSLVALNEELNMPKMDFNSNCPPAKFAPFSDNSLKKAGLGSANSSIPVILSITSKARRRQIEDAYKALKVQKAQRAKQAAQLKKKLLQKLSPRKKTDKNSKTPEKPRSPVEEPKFITLQNPARVIPAQAKFITLANNELRYEPVKPLNHGGIIMMRDRKPQEPVVIVEPAKPSGPVLEDDREPEPPQPFEYRE